MAQKQSDRGSRFVASEEHWAPARWTGELGRLALDAIDRFGAPRAKGERPAHQEGFVLKGAFVPLKPGPTKTLLSEYTCFKPFTLAPATPATVRLSKLMGDFDEPGILGMAVRLGADDDDVTDLLSLSIDVLPVATTRDFAVFANAVRRGVRGGPRLAAMVAARRASARALVRTWQAARIDHGNGLATTFHGGQTYRLVQPGRRQRAPAMFTPTRFCWVPDRANPAGPYRNTFSSGGEGTEDVVRFHLDLHVRPLPPGIEQQERERLDDPRHRWQRSTLVIRAGTLELEPVVVPEEPGSLGFNPGSLGVGLAMGSNDMFSGRQSANNISFARRAAEAGRLG